MYNEAIGEVGAKIIGYGLTKAKFLQYLQLGKHIKSNIGFCKINAEGAKALSEGIKYHLNLKGLFLGKLINNHRYFIH